MKKILLILLFIFSIGTTKPMDNILDNYSGRLNVCTEINDESGIKQIIKNISGFELRDSDLNNFVSRHSFFQAFKYALEYLDLARDMLSLIKKLNNPLSNKNVVRILKYALLKNDLNFYTFDIINSAKKIYLTNWILSESFTSINFSNSSNFCSASSIILSIFIKSSLFSFF